jgi:hypothetical protein
MAPAHTPYTTHHPQMTGTWSMVLDEQGGEMPFISYDTITKLYIFIHFYHFVFVTTKE